MLFIRFSEALKLREKEKRVASATLTVTASDATGTVLVTDVMLQKGSYVSGYTPDTAEFTTPSQASHHFNGVFRGRAAFVVPGSGSFPTALDITVQPKQATSAVKAAMGVGSHRASFGGGAAKDDVLQLKASTREALKNGQPAEKRGFFSYIAVWDDHHIVEVDDRKGANVLFEFTETEEAAQQ
jgi:hypothetical protein